MVDVLGALRTLTLHQVDFLAVVFAGLTAGYVMAVMGLWAGRIPGLIALDIADFGRRYLVSDRPSAWVLGMVAHLTNSVLLTFVWASLIEPNLHWWRPLEGVAWGLVLAFTLAGTLVAPLTGMGFMGMKSRSFRFAATNLLVHTAWGLLIGLLYTPR
jgi:hypothetical protein